MLYTSRIIITIFQVLEITSRLNEIHKRQLFFVIKTFKIFISVSEKHNCTSLYSQDVIGHCRFMEFLSCNFDSWNPPGRVLFFHGEKLCGNVLYMAKNKEFATTKAQFLPN